MADGALRDGGHLRHDTPTAKCEISEDRSGFLERVIHLLVAEQMPTGSGRWLRLHRWGFVADSTPELRCNVRGRVLSARFTRYGTLYR